MSLKVTSITTLHAGNPACTHYDMTIRKDGIDYVIMIGENRINQVINSIIGNLPGIPSESPEEEQRGIALAMLWYSYHRVKDAPLPIVALLYQEIERGR